MHDLSPESIIARVKAVEAQVKAAGLSMTKICSDADVSHSTWQRWRNGDSSPRVDNLYRVEVVARAAVAAAPQAAE